MSRPLDRFFAPKSSKKKSQRRLPLAPSVPRLRILLIMVAVTISLLAGRAIQVQAIDASPVAIKANDQNTLTRTLPAMRGTVTDRNGEILAYTQDTVAVTVNPRMVATNGRMNAEMTPKDKEVAAGAPPKLAAILAQYLGGSPQDYLPKLTASNAYQPIKNGVPAATYRALRQAVSDAGLVGVEGTSQPTRSYPNGVLASNVVGFINAQGVGSAGLELVLDKSLSGTPGKEVYQSSLTGEKIPMGTNILVPAINGSSYRTSLDDGLQWQAQQAISDQVRRMDAKWGGVVITNPKTGEILAMAVSPSYDPSNYGKADPATLGNRTVTDTYTPGSVEKVLTFASLIDQGLVDPSEVVTVPSKIKSGDQWVRDAWNHGTIKLYARGIVAKSSNIGTIEVARRASKQSLHDYLTAFGMGAKTKVGLPGEAAGSLPPADMPDYSRDGLAFGGSAITTTMIQMASAVGTIANGGVYNPPQLLLSQTLPDGTIQPIAPGQTRRVVSEDTSVKVLSMMEAMAQASPSRQFDVTGYRVGAKTGTSKKFDSACGCFRGLVTSAISVAPIENPQLLVYVVLDEPRRGGSGSVVAGPVVRDLMSVGLARYAIPQSSVAAPKLPIQP